MRFLLPALGLSLMAACAPQIPDSAAGIGFGDYGSHIRARDAQTARAAPTSIVPPPQVHSIPGPPHTAARPAPFETSEDAQSIAAAALAAVRPQASAPAPSDPLPLPPAAMADPVPPVSSGPATIYRDQVLDMETARATRAAEQAAFERRRAEFTMVEPTAVPERPDDVPNLFAYALRTTHTVGEQRYRRSRFTRQDHLRNCMQFPSPDLAQEEFLRQGGPERDPLNLDPDGDGFACRWSPEPFRAAARAAN